MVLGDLLLKLAFAAALASGLLFAGSLRGRRPPAAGQWAFTLHAAQLLAAMGLLAWCFVAHRFEFEYVAQFSSRSLSPAMSLAASWAGQEGSILLWAMIGGLLGLALLRQPGSLSRPALFFVSWAQVFMLVLLTVRSPFRLNAVVPPDGQGLNPLLEDPWMVIHPPVLFVGYAALLLPFALAAAALARRDYKDWDRMVWPWALFGVISLGLGIGLGGVWAYKVLGWGGYWGWDPVENASLIPWLVAVALLHGLLIQRATGAALRTNLLLSLLGWIAVLGGTYVTRSGVLQDFSVHSFANSGLNAPLTVFLLSTAAIGALLIVLRWRSLRAPLSNWLVPTREAALWAGLLTVVVLAILVSVGTTAPLITALMGHPANVQTRFYEGIIVLLGFVILLLMTVTPALRATRQESANPLGYLVPGLSGLLLVLVCALVAGIRQPAFLALAAATGGALGANLGATLRNARRGWRQAAGALGHVGIALMALGIVVSSSLGRSERVRLPQGADVRALGYTLTYEGQEPGARGEQMLRIRVRDRGFIFDARPRLLAAPSGEGMIRTPAIHGLRDLYVSPLEVEQSATSPGSITWLAQGQETAVGGVGYVFAGFRVESRPQPTIFADIDVRRGGRTQRVSPAMKQGTAGYDPLPVDLAGLGSLVLAGVDPDHGRAAVLLPGAAGGGSVALVELSTKPLVNLVWIGALLALAATALAALRRASTAGAERPRGPADVLPAAR
jgi:cytochrome c-type biogenesis protein CcmF